MEGQLKRLNKVIYMEHGSSDEEGYQIFTPEFIVNGMVDAIGKKEVLDFSKTILEPTSGDGAFTCRILLMRLKTIKDNYAINALKALSTIYSIEMDEELIIKQRNNIYTIVCDYADKKKIKDQKFFKCLEDIIFTNFIWGMTNIIFLNKKEQYDFSLFSIDDSSSTKVENIAYYMPISEKEIKEDINIEKKGYIRNSYEEALKNKRVKFYSWIINDDLSYEKKPEDIES